ncbi:BLACE isoform 2 [Pongo abelii]|uniref:BLACE isoform 1 n=1 Tax=Pongo abelii TaxID=9601 RepID=A0A2J8TDU6_PONAB|nr:BLACE isoform 1 [Pongo abelii]PNJ31206.1 BLACE isoform 2 [Pongo abelii]
MTKAIIPASSWALEESTDLENGSFPLSAAPRSEFPRRRALEERLLSLFLAGQAESEGQLVLERVRDTPPPVASPGGDGICVSSGKAPSSPGGSTHAWLYLTRHFPWNPFPHGGWTDTSESCVLETLGGSSLAALWGNGLWVQSSGACAFCVYESLTEQSLPSEKFEELLLGPSPGEAMK